MLGFPLNPVRWGAVCFLEAGRLERPAVLTRLEGLLSLTLPFTSVPPLALFLNTVPPLAS